MFYCFTLIIVSYQHNRKWLNFQTIYYIKVNNNFWIYLLRDHVSYIGILNNRGHCSRMNRLSNLWRIKLDLWHVVTHTLPTFVFLRLVSHVFMIIWSHHHFTIRVESIQEYLMISFVSRSFYRIPLPSSHNLYS